MYTLEINGDITRPEDGAWLRAYGMEDTTVSTDTIRAALREAGADTDILININSFGGVVDEALTIYDILRMSGKNIHANIIGECHSAAIILLLAAPAENRTANPNARALIHKVYCPVCDMVTAEDAFAVAKSLKDAEDAILDIYEQRTTADRETLEALMDAEEVQTADALLQYGFITKINNYNTNIYRPKTKNMSKISTRWDKFLANARNAVGIVAMNYDYTDAEGKVLFSTEGGPDEVLKVGDEVKIAEEGKTSGEFELGDGRKVTVEDNIVTEIEESDADNENAAELEELRNLVAEGMEVVNELREENAKLEAENNVLRKQVRSNAKPATRMTAPGNNAVRTQSGEELKNAAKEMLDKMRNRK